MAEPPQRHLDLGGPADPRAEWREVDVEALPVAWRVVDRGRLQEVRVLARTPEVVVVLAENDRRGRDVVPWYRLDARVLNPDEVYPDRRDAAVAAVARLQQYASVLANDMGRLVAAAGVKTEDLDDESV